MAMPGFIRCKENTSATTQTVHTFSFKSLEGSLAKTVKIKIETASTDSTRPLTEIIELTFQGKEDTQDTNLVHLDPNGTISFDKEAEEVVYELPGESEVVVSACKIYRPGGGTGN